MKEKKALLRIVRSPEGEISLDLTGKKAGRGAYVCQSKECITKAVKEKRLERALEKPVSEEVYAKLLEDLPQKAGKLASGDYAVRSALKNGKAKLLLVAADAAENSKKDMYFMAEMSDTPVVECLTRDELGWAIGKAKRTAVVVLDNSFANMINKNI